MGAFTNLCKAYGACALFEGQEASGTNAVDSGVCNNPATYNSSGVAYHATSLLAGESGAFSIDFNGSTGYCDIPAIVVENLWVNNRRSVVLWAKSDVTTSDKRVLELNREMFFSIRYGLPGTTGIRFSIRDSAGQKDLDVTGLTLTNALMIAVTWEVGVDMKAYINNGAANTISLAAGKGTVSVTGSVWGAARDHTTNFDGKSSHLAFFPYRLSATQISKLYDAGINGVQYFPIIEDLSAGGKRRLAGADDSLNPAIYALPVVGR